jgi:hypothetical protein
MTPRERTGVDRRVLATFLYRLIVQRIAMELVPD